MTENAAKGRKVAPILAHLGGSHHGASDPDTREYQNGAQSTSQGVEEDVANGRVPSRKTRLDELHRSG